MLPRADWGRRCRRGRGRALALLPPVLSRGPPERRGGPLRSGRLLEEHQSTGVHSPRTGKTIGAGPFPEASTRPPGKALSLEVVIVAAAVSAAPLLFPETAPCHRAPAPPGGRPFGPLAGGHSTSTLWGVIHAPKGRGAPRLSHSEVNHGYLR